MSGDTIILAHPNDPRKERTLSLAFVTSPRLRRDDDEVCDLQDLRFGVGTNAICPQPFAFASRDFLRKLLVGRVVNFKVLYVIPSSKREYGILWVPNGPQIPEAAVAEGWLKLRDDAGKRDEESPEITALVEKLQLSEAHAKADSKGLWAGPGEGAIKCAYELSDAKDFSEKNKGKTFDGKRGMFSLLPIEC
jgi:staphylococcal nuclease domain-containing protein 1